MWLPQFPAARTAIVLSALVSIGLAPAPALAQAAGECDALCRIGGYLSSDHMAAQPVEEAQASRSGGARRPRAAARKSAGTPAAAAPVRPRVAVAAAKRAPARPVPDAVRPAASARPRAVATAGANRSIPPGWVVGPAPAAPRPVAAAAAEPPQARPEPARSAQARSEPAASTRLATAAPRSTRTASAGSVIPGSAPAMQAGFH